MGKVPNGSQYNRTPESPDAELLTDIEKEIISFIGHGLKDHEIAGRLKMNEVDLSDHINSIYKKLQVSARPGLVMRAYQKGLLNLTLTKTPPEK